jgi:hypothetical protein
VSGGKGVTLQKRHCAAAASGAVLTGRSPAVTARWPTRLCGKSSPFLGGVREVRLRKSSSPPRARSKQIRWEIIKLQASPARMIGVVSAVDEEEARAAAIVQYKIRPTDRLLIRKA